MLAVAAALASASACSSSSALAADVSSQSAGSKKGSTVECTYSSSSDGVTLGLVDKPTTMRSSAMLAVVVTKFFQCKDVMQRKRVSELRLTTTQQSETDAIAEMLKYAYCTCGYTNAIAALASASPIAVLLHCRRCTIEMMLLLVLRCYYHYYQ
jgi:hypothetical protein